MKSPADIFIGITSWNSELFLPHCLRAILRTTKSLRRRVVVLDNRSTDQSATIASQMGAEVIVRSCSQADGLNFLLRCAHSPYVLLLHADVALLSDRWFELCVEKVSSDGVALVSPEDIGCGPYSRPFGLGKPESSFLFFATKHLSRIRELRWGRWRGIPIPQFDVNFYGNHVTHDLPARLKAKNLTWCPMDVHISSEVSNPIYVPSFKPTVWSDELCYLKYGLGNFYSLDGTITHYHNWYDRVERNVELASTRTTAANGEGFPLAYIKTYTDAFLRDYANDELTLPNPAKSNRVPKAL